MEQFLQGCIDYLKKFRLFRESRFGQFIISVLAELQKVTWPSRQDVKSSTVVTLIVMLILATFMGAAQAAVGLIYDGARQFFGVG